jgi:RimJ/RimL family protein N-acetyltransferase
MMTPEPDIRIEPLERSDLPDLAAMLHDPDVVRFTRVPDPPPADFFDTWFARYEDGRVDGTREAFAIVDDEHAILGIALAPAIDRETATVELGYVIHEGARGHGVASRALALLTEWAFGSLEAKRIELYISPANEGSKRVATKNGYVYEGTLRSLAFKQDVRTDTEIWSKLPTDP